MNEIEKKEIEEMARVMAKCEKTCDECFAEYEKLFTQSIQDRSKHCQAIEYCTTLYNAGYRNVKDKVVLTEEEYQNDFSNQFNKGYERGSKETAREIFEKIKEKLKDCPEVIEESYDLQNDVEYFLDIEGYNKEFTNEIIEDLAKEYGVEVE